MGSGKGSDVVEVERGGNVDRDHVRLWVDALRSGLYEQARGKLSDGDGYCCLGVACEVAMANGVELRKVRSIEDDGVWVSYDEANSMLPQSVAKWLGLGACCPTFEHSTCDRLADTVYVLDGATSVTVLNDRMKLDFNRIADALEKDHLGD